MYLAIGIRDDQSGTWSIATPNDFPQTVADQLAERQDGWTPEEILLVANGNIDAFDGQTHSHSSPEVVGHFFYGKHYN